MKKNYILLGLSFLLVVAMLLASCSTSTTSTSKSSTTTATISTTISTTQTTSAVVTTTPPATTTATGNWWDSLGTPTYGGTLTIRSSVDVNNWDPYNSPGSTSLTAMYLEHLTGDMWTEDPTTYNYQLDWRPADFVAGNLAATYEFTDPTTYVLHLRQGIHWQDIPPANGREFIASDVVAHFQRFFGTGIGWSKGSPYYAFFTPWQELQSVTAPDNYTVVFKWGVPNAELINELMDTADACTSIECPDAVKTWGDLNDWHHAIGTGPFMVTDFVSGGSATLVKNPNYWGYDERYPQNQLPYIEKLSVLIIVNDATALAAMRSGKIDIMYGMSQTQAATMKTSNPDISQLAVVGGSTTTLIPRDDTAPFNDIRVREALQMAINLPEIASDFYGGTTSPDPSTLTSNNLTGWGLAYSEWPQDLKDQYAYNVPQAKTLLTAAGLPNGFNTNCVASTNNDLDLLQIVQNDFAAINVTMSITTMEQGAWTNYVRRSHKNDALAYGSDFLGLSYEPTMQISCYISSSEGDFGWLSDKTYDQIYATAQAATTLSDFKTALTAANKEVAEQHFAISLLSPSTFAFVQPWLKGYNGQAFAADFSQGSPMYGGFYCARFWIDSNLKASMKY